MRSLFQRRRWYVGTVGVPGGVRVPSSEARAVFSAFDNGIWDAAVYPSGPWLSGGLDIGWFSFMSPFEPDKRIKYWRQ